MTKYDYKANYHKLIASNGTRLTVGLFEELTPDSTAAKPVFKLADWRKTYVEIADPTDYEAALCLIGDWDHWVLLTKNQTFMAHLALWRDEVEAKLRSQAVAQMMKHAKGPTGTAAAKWLAEGGFVDKPKRGPKKEETPDRSQLSADAKRLGL